LKTSSTYQTYNEYCQKAWYGKQNKYFNALSYLKLEAGFKVLDVGFGRSPMPGLLREAGCSVVGMDISNTAIDFARKDSGGIIILKADAAHIPFADRVFDRIIMLDVLEELEGGVFLKALSEAKRVLKNDGFILIHYPNIWGNWLEYFSIRYIKRDKEQAEYFYRSFTRTKILHPLEFGAILKENGLKNKVWFAGSSLLDKPSLLRRLANTFLFYLTAIWVKAAKA